MREHLVDHKQASSFHTAPSSSHLTLKKPKKKGLLKRKAVSCTGQVSIDIPEDTIGVTGGAGMIEMQLECEWRLLPVHGAKAVLAKRLKQHCKEPRHHSAKRAKPKNISSFFASYQPTKKTQPEDLKLIFVIFFIFFVEGHPRRETAWVVVLAPT